MFWLVLLLTALYPIPAFVSFALRASDLSPRVDERVLHETSPNLDLRS